MKNTRNYLLVSLLVILFLTGLAGCALFMPNTLVEKWSKEEMSLKNQLWQLDSVQIDTPEGAEELKSSTEDLLRVFIRKHNEDILESGTPLFISVKVEEGSLFYGHTLENTLTLTVKFYDAPPLKRSSPSPLGVVIVTRESERSIMSGKELMKMLKKTFREIP